MSEMKKLIWGGFAAMILAPLLVLVLCRAKLAYALDFGSATIAAKTLEAGTRPASHNVTVQGGVVDTAHCVLWRLLQDGSERERYYLCPARAKGSGPAQPVGIIVTSKTELTRADGDLQGLLRDEGGEGPSGALQEKLRQQGLKVAKNAVLIELGGSGSSEALSLAFWVALAFFVPMMVAVPLWLHERKAKWEAGAEDRLKAFQATPAYEEVKGIERELFQAARRFLPADTEKSVLVRASKLVGPLQAFVAIDGDEQPAPADVFALLQRLLAVLARNKADMQMIAYNFLWSERESSWRMTGGPR